MQLDRVEMTETGIVVYDVDGSCVELSVEDARELLHWLSRHCVELYKIYREMLKEQKQKEEQKA